RDSGKYEETIKNKKFIILDGCATRCATKLAIDKGITVSQKISVLDMIKETGIKPEKELSLGPDAVKISSVITEKIEKTFIKEERPETEKRESSEKEIIEYYEVMVDKFILKVPKAGYVFNENDFWAKVKGDKAKIGITDYVQTNVGDIMYVELPEIGTEVSQFDDICSFESSKTLLSAVSPVSGTVTRINEKVLKSHQLLNEDPYGEGWLIEIKLTDFKEDMELLMEGHEYFEKMKAKAQKEIDNIYQE
ncbi:MAG: glycine cleavage system protein GcvH, partial [Candidatus Eremiobacterota bacterium]